MIEIIKLTNDISYEKYVKLVEYVWDKPAFVTSQYIPSLKQARLVFISDWSVPTAKELYKIINE